MNKLKKLKLFVTGVIIILFMIAVYISLIKKDVEAILSGIKIILIYTAFLGIIFGGAGSRVICWLQLKTKPSLNRAAVKIGYISCGAIAAILFFINCCKSRDVTDLAELIFTGAITISITLYLKSEDFA